MSRRSKPGLQSLLSDRAVMEEMANKPATLEAMHQSLGAESTERLLNGDVASMAASGLTQVEAIILLKGRPALLIQDDAWEDPESDVITQRLGPPARLKLAIQKVGRVEILDFPMDYVGTGWMIEEDLLITNRHVAESFAQRNGTTFAFRADPAGVVYKARVDFRREHDRTNIHQARVLEIVMLEEPGSLRPDMALVRLATDDAPLPQPIELDSASLRFDPEHPLDIAVVGYPARDSRNDSFELSRIFRDIYNVKRLSPGRLMGVRPDGKLLEHDGTTLGGNSGSVVVNLSNGKACGLHFAGSYRDRNFAVSAHWLKTRLSEMSDQLYFVPTAQPALESTNAPVLDGRSGYDPQFLGKGDEYLVELPSLNAELKALVAPVSGSGGGELKYTHFSILIRSDRRLPFFTAVNIDGGKLFNFPRAKDRWLLDSRLVDQDHQIGPELYSGNNLDRGHLVRRLDPAWGDTRAEAKEGELDSFFYTNSSPQHSRLNQRIWLNLEDYILSNSEALGLRVTVFSGPVFAEADPSYRGVQIPQEYWKVVVLVNDETRALSATGYLQSQADYLGDIEFVFGEHKTYQVSLEIIERKCGLRFGLSDFDPLSRVERQPAHEVRAATDVVL